MKHTWISVMWVKHMSAIAFSVGSQTASFRLGKDWSDRIPTAPILVPGTGGLEIYYDSSKVLAKHYNITFKVTFTTAIKMTKYC